MKRLVLGAAALAGIALTLGGTAAPTRAADNVRYEFGGGFRTSQQGFSGGGGAAPQYDGFQLWATRPPGSNAMDDMPLSHRPSDDSVSRYATYGFAGEDWGVTWSGGGSWRPNDGAGGAGNNSDYRTGLSLMLGNFGIGGGLEYYDFGGADNDAYVARGGLTYALDPWTFGLQGSRGAYDGAAASGFTADLGNSHTLNRVTATGLYELAPGITLDGEIGYTWFQDTGDSAADDQDRTRAYDIAIGSAFRF